MVYPKKLDVFFARLAPLGGGVIQLLPKLVVRARHVMQDATARCWVLVKTIVWSVKLVSGAMLLELVMSICARLVNLATTPL